MLHTVCSRLSKTAFSFPKQKFFLGESLFHFRNTCLLRKLCSIACFHFLSYLLHTAHTQTYSACQTFLKRVLRLLPECAFPEHIFPKFPKARESQKAKIFWQMHYLSTHQHLGVAVIKCSLVHCCRELLLSVPPIFFLVTFTYFGCIIETYKILYYKCLQETQRDRNWECSWLLRTCIFTVKPYFCNQY